jgi:hypothetical protein
MYTRASDPCNWLTAELIFPAPGSSQTVRSVLDDGGYGEGND